MEIRTDDPHLTDVVRELRKESKEKSRLCYPGEAAALRKASDMIERWMQDILRAPECSVADALGVEDGDE